MKMQLESVLDDAIRNNWENPTPPCINAFVAIIEVYERGGSDGSYYRITAQEMRKKLYQK